MNYELRIILYLCEDFDTTTMIEKIQKLIEEVGALQAKNADEVEALRIKYLSKKGELNALMADFRLEIGRAHV